MANVETCCDIIISVISTYLKSLGCLRGLFKSLRRFSSTSLFMCNLCWSVLVFESHLKGEGNLWLIRSIPATPPPSILVLSIGPLTFSPVLWWVVIDTFFPSIIDWNKSLGMMKPLWVSSGCLSIELFQMKTNLWGWSVTVLNEKSICVFRRQEVNWELHQVWTDHL